MAFPEEFSEDIPPKRTVQEQLSPEQEMIHKKVRLANESSPELKLLTNRLQNYKKGIGQLKIIDKIKTSLSTSAERVEIKKALEKGEINADELFLLYDLTPDGALDKQLMEIITTELSKDDIDDQKVVADKIPAASAEENPMQSQMDQALKGVKIDELRSERADDVVPAIATDPITPTAVATAPAANIKNTEAKNPSVAESPTESVIEQRRREIEDRIRENNETIDTFEELNSMIDKDNDRPKSQRLQKFIQSLERRKQVLASMIVGGGARSYNGDQEFWDQIDKGEGPDMWEISEIAKSVITPEVQRQSEPIRQSENWQELIDAIKNIEDIMDLGNTDYPKNIPKGPQIRNIDSVKVATQDAVRDLMGRAAKTPEKIDEISQEIRMDLLDNPTLRRITVAMGIRDAVYRQIDNDISKKVGEIKEDAAKLKELGENKGEISKQSFKPRKIEGNPLDEDVLSKYLELSPEEVNVELQNAREMLELLKKFPSISELAIDEQNIFVLFLEQLSKYKEALVEAGDDVKKKEGSEMDFDIKLHEMQQEKVAKMAAIFSREVSSLKENTGTIEKKYE
jgi:hypothetical protein